MEKGTLIILKGKKGFIVKLSFTKSDGRTAEMPVFGYTPKDDKYNNTECTFRRDKGQLVELITHDGAILVGGKTQPQAQNSNAGSTYTEGVADSYNPIATFLPNDIKNILARGVSPDNFSLKLNKAARYDDEKTKFQFFKRDRRGENYEIRANYGNIDFKQIAAREYTNAQSLLGDNYIRKIDLATDWRIIQGLGIESVYEVSMTLHHVYGIPYIPASVLKGVVRSWIIAEVFDSKEEKAIADKIFCDWFGCPGEVVLERESDGKKRKLKYPSFFVGTPLSSSIILP